MLGRLLVFGNYGISFSEKKINIVIKNKQWLIEQRNK